MTMTWADMPSTWDAITGGSWDNIGGLDPVEDHELTTLDLIMGYYNGEGIDPPVSPPLRVEIAIWDVTVSTLFARDVVMADLTFVRNVGG
jgi:hypothetical protein